MKNAIGTGGHSIMLCLHRRTDAPQQDEQFSLTDGYSIRSKAYIYDGDLHLCGSESELLDNEGIEGNVRCDLDTDRIWYRSQLKYY